MAEKKQRLWAWDISAYVYAWTYNRVAHQIDVDMLTYLGSRVTDAIVADCGCGPGVVSEKMLEAGAARVVAIDSNAAMVEQTRARLARLGGAERGIVRCMSHEGKALSLLSQQELGGSGFDIILFKRSLYTPRPRALETLRDAAVALRKQGVIIVIHPEKSLSRYVCAPPFGLARYSLFHLFNRAISRAAEWVGAEEYTLYSHDELVDLMREAVPEATVRPIPSQQRPFNLVALHIS
jgi:SAM-dependent methyltransferase